MDFNDTPKEADFRAKVRKFLDDNCEKRSNNSLFKEVLLAPLKQLKGEKVLQKNH